jgi:hypothetical protein
MPFGEVQICSGVLAFLELSPGDNKPNQDKPYNQNNQNALCCMIHLYDSFFLSELWVAL